MSFLLIRGQMAHCEFCDSLGIIEYSGGPQLTQIGDLGVYSQKLLHDKFFKKEYNPEVEGYYFHAILVCEKCIEKGVHNDKENLLIDSNSPANSIDNFFCITKKYTEKIDEKVDILKEHYSLDYSKLRNLNPSAYESTIESKVFKLTFKKPELVDKYIISTRPYIEEDFKRFLISTPEFVKLLHRYEALIKKPEMDMKELLKSGKKKYYYKIDLSLTQSLNPYIVNYMTIRQPEKIQTAEEFYSTLQDFPLNKIRESLEKTTIERLIKEAHPAHQYILEKIKLKLLQI